MWTEYGALGLNMENKHSFNNIGESMQIFLQSIMCHLIIKKVLIFPTYAKWWFGNYTDHKMDIKLFTLEYLS